MRKFLIVDDNVALAENLAEIIYDADLGEVVLAESGMRALELAADIQFDALVSDIRMPRMSGVELFQRMRLIDPGLPAIFVSAHAQGDELVSTRHEGVLCILSKPVPIARLLDELAHACRNGRAWTVARAPESQWSQVAREPGVFSTRSDPERMMKEIESLCDGFPGCRSTRVPAATPAHARTIQ